MQFASIVAFSLFAVAAAQPPPAILFGPFMFGRLPEPQSGGRLPGGLRGGSDRPKMFDEDGPERPEPDTHYTCPAVTPTCDLYVEKEDVDEDEGDRRRRKVLDEDELEDEEDSEEEGRKHDHDYEVIEGGGVRICRQSPRDATKTFTMCVNHTDFTVVGFDEDDCGCCGGECPEPCNSCACTVEETGAAGVEVEFVKRGPMGGEMTWKKCVSEDMSVTLQLEGGMCTTCA